MTGKYVNLGRSGLRVSRLGLGTFNFGNPATGCDAAVSTAIIHAALDAGLNYVDTANIYGGSEAERFVGRALKGRRDAVVLATKGGAAWGPGPHERGSSRKALIRAVEDSLGRLGTDHIDLYQIHQFDPLTPMEETLATLDRLVRAGKILHYGVSNWTASQIVEAEAICRTRGLEPVISLQPQYNLLMRDIEAEIVPACLKRGIGIVPWSPLAGSLLTGRFRAGRAVPEGGRLAMFPAMRSRLTPKAFEIIEAVVAAAERLGSTPVAVALAWLMRQPGVTAPLIGPETVEQLEGNLAALTLDLPPETLARLDAVSAPVLAYPHNFGRRP